MLLFLPFLALLYVTITVDERNEKKERGRTEEYGNNEGNRAKIESSSSSSSNRWGGILSCSRAAGARLACNNKAQCRMSLANDRDLRIMIDDRDDPSHFGSISSHHIIISSVDPN